MKYADICTMDTQGRIVIPARIRRFLKITDGEPLQVELTGQEIHLHRCNDTDADYRKAKSFLAILHGSIRHAVFLYSKHQVIAAAGIYLPDGTPVPDTLSAYVTAGMKATLEPEPPVFMPPYREPVAALFPVHGKRPAALAVLSKKPLSEMELGCAGLIASMLEHEINQ